MFVRIDKSEVKVTNNKKTNRYCTVAASLRQLSSLLPPTKEEVHILPVFVCLSVCLSVSKITQKRVNGFG